LCTNLHKYILSIIYKKSNLGPTAFDLGIFVSVEFFECFVVVAAVLSLDSGSRKQRAQLKQPLNYDVAVLDGIKS
jgi:hypothetical protein